MSKRLDLIASLVPSGKGMIDVGTDHGYLPVLLAQAGYEGALFASDIHPGPLAAARRTASAAGLEDRICFQLCDGLALCPPEKIDTIVIAGMGGDMIVKILDEAEWCMDRRYQLVLQPATKAEVLRYWLVNNEFCISAEQLVKEGGSLYQILCAHFGGKTELNDAELFAGKRSLAGDGLLYDKHVQMIKRRFRNAIAGMKKAEMSPRLDLYLEILNQLERMEDPA